MRGHNAVEVKLPKEYSSRHPVFPTSLTELHAKSPEQSESRREHNSYNPPVVLDISGDDLWEVDFIRKERTRRTKNGPIKNYPVHWKGWDVAYGSWEREDDMQADEAISHFRRAQRSKWSEALALFERGRMS